MTEIVIACNFGLLEFGLLVLPAISSKGDIAVAILFAVA